ncbi:hypothetical protein Vadar_016754 [Vaccinium darrowii]|uniref:Uncharacterized protein n=1 Tax=Vaccinium darrowii TaxID=229202 RepID=A0ACB7YX03_9ERIC|nr:hypothetical protein Vadar_016754 [Vaccinium darrowii]
MSTNRLALALAIAVVILSPTTILAKGGNKSSTKKNSSVMNVIDGCWRSDPNWRHHRQHLARCSVGYAGKMTDNIGPNVTRYKVTDDGDDALDPKPGTLRYGATMIKGKVWITFHKDKQIKLQKPLLVSSFTTIDGRGADVHIAGGGCLVLLGVTKRIKGNGPTGWNFGSTKDLFENGATFTQTSDDAASVDPHYSRLQAFRVEKATSVRALTWSAGVLRCRKRSRSKC